MLAQIIFFFAVALFLILVLRRAHLLEAIWRFLGSALVFVGTWTSTVFRSWPAIVKKRPGLPNLRFPQLSNRRVKQAQPASGNEQGGSEFWKEEMMDEKMEIMTHYEEGEGMFKAGKLEEAEKFFLTAATRNPKDAKVYARLGLIYLQKKSYSDAIEALKVAVKLDKYNPTRYYNLALAYSGKSDNQRAIATIREAISLDPVSQKYRTLLEQLLNKK